MLGAETLEVLKLQVSYFSAVLTLYFPGVHSLAQFWNYLH